jgi:hypothetical protein
MAPRPRGRLICSALFDRHCEERSDAAIQSPRKPLWIASLRSQWRAYWRHYSANAPNRRSFVAVKRMSGLRCVI